MKVGQMKMTSFIHGKEICEFWREIGYFLIYKIENCNFSIYKISEIMKNFVVVLFFNTLLLFIEILNFSYFSSLF